MYRGKLNDRRGTAFAHLYNALMVISNLVAYHNRCEPHRAHPPIPILAATDVALGIDRGLPYTALADDYSDSDDEEEGDDGMDVDRPPALEMEVVECEQPSRKRRRLQPQPPLPDQRAQRVDFGLYEYKWDEGEGTGYAASDFRRQQGVWVWHPAFQGWMTAVVTHIRRDEGGVNVRVLDTDEVFCMQPGLLRPRA